MLHCFTRETMRLMFWSKTRMIFGLSLMTLRYIKHVWGSFWLYLLLQCGFIDTFIWMETHKRNLEFRCSIIYNLLSIYVEHFLFLRYFHVITFPQLILNPLYEMMLYWYTCRLALSLVIHCFRKRTVLQMIFTMCLLFRVTNLLNGYSYILTNYRHGGYVSKLGWWAGQCNPYFNGW